MASTEENAFSTHKKNAHSLLRSSKFFSSLSDEEIDLVAQACELEIYESDSVIFREGSEADKCYIVLDGIVEVWKNYQSATEEADLLAVHGSGHFFGEMALIDDLPRSATVVVRDRSQFLTLGRDDFLGLVRNRASIAIAVMTAISTMVRNANDNYVARLRERNLELEKAYADLQTAHQEILRAERLSTLGKFASQIFHDIRNPHSILLGQLQLMKLRIMEPEKLANHISMCLSQLRRLEILTSDFLDFTKGGIKIRLGACSIKALLDQALDAFADKFGQAHIEVSMEIGYSKSIILDQDRMLRVLVNLLDNARKAMPDGGKLSLSAIADEKMVYVTIRDTGVGMDAATIERVFEPFFSGFESTGIGLGMMIVKNIIDAHKGSISIESRLGQGTAITLGIPLSYTASI